MLIELPHGKGPGKWQRIIVDEFGDKPRWSAIIRCPACGMYLPIPNHTIAPDGQVTPSVGHPVGACGWHPPSPKLLGWAPCPPVPEPRPVHECATCGIKTRQLCGWSVTGLGLLCPACMKVLLVKSIPP
jgi:hypothetical protein